jgi:hypothetical protein
LTKMTERDTVHDNAFADMAVPQSGL